MTKKKVVVSDQEQIAWALLNAKADGVTLVDRNGIILLINETAAEQFAKPVDTLIGACVWDFYPPANLSHHKMLLNQVVQTGQSITSNNQTNDRWIRTLIYPVRGETGLVERVALCT